MSVSSLANPSVLDRVLDDFDAAWQSGTTPHIENFLTSVSRDAAERREALEELVKIDLEYRWR